MEETNQVKRVVRLRCECGAEFERPEKYKKYHKEQPKTVMWKWKLKYCDLCFKKRTNKALKRLPEIIKVLMKEDLKA